MFDADDLTLWAAPLPYRHLYVFVSDAHARAALARYAGQLSTIPPALLLADEDEDGANGGGGDATAVTLSIWCVISKGGRVMGQSCVLTCVCGV